MLKIKTFFNSIPRFFTATYFVFLMLSILLVVVGIYFIRPIALPEYENLNIIFFSISLLLIIGLTFIFLKFKTTNFFEQFEKGNLYWIIFFMLLFVAILFQILLITNYIYSPVGDTNAVNYGMFRYVSSVLNCDVNEAVDESNQLAIAYRVHLENHRNLLFIAGLYLRLYEIFSGCDLGFLTQFGTEILSNTQVNSFGVYMIAECMSSILVIGAIVLTALSVRKLTNSFISLIAFGLMLLLTALSPNCIATYTDSFSIFIVSTGFYLYACVNNKLTKSILYPLLFFIGYNIKPTTVAVFLAIIAIEFCRWIVKDKHIGKNIKELPVKIKTASFWKSAKNYIIFIIMIPVSLFLTSAVSSFGIEINQSMQLPFTHYLMLGLNNVNDGRYFSAEEYYTENYDNDEDKISANLDVVGKRLFSNPITDNLALFAKKAIIAYGSGSFKPHKYYYFSQIHDESPFLTAIYGAGLSTNEEIANVQSSSDGYQIYNVLAQILWFMALIGSFLFLYKKRDDRRIHVLALSMLMITVFLLLFEANERYMFLYSLFPVILMSCYFYGVYNGEYNFKIKNPFKKRVTVKNLDESENSEEDESEN